jgi:hypothetical protein
MTTDASGNRPSSDFSGRVLAQGKHLAREGTVQRVLIKREDETIVQLPIIVAILLVVDRSAKLALSRLAERSTSTCDMC